MAKKIVRYNGGTESSHICTKPTKLVIGQKYEVLSERVGEHVTIYTLNGVRGFFNAAWFDEVSKPELPEAVLALSNEMPVIGNYLECSKIEQIEGKYQLRKCRTDMISGVKQLGSNVYHVTTERCVYIVLVN